MKSRFFWLLFILLVLFSLGAGDVLQVIIDIQPCKEPNIVSFNKPTLLPVAIYGDYDFTEASLELQGVVVSEWVYKSGYLLAKFDSAAVVATLGSVKDGEIYSLTLTGQLQDNIPFAGYDEIVIRKRGAR